MSRAVFVMVVLLGMAMLVMAPRLNAEIFRFVDDEGVVYYTDVPLKGARAKSGHEGPGGHNVQNRQVSEKVVAPRVYKKPSPVKTPAVVAKVAKKYVPGGEAARPRIEPPSIAITGVSTDYGTIVESLSKKHSLDPMLVKAIIKAESNWNSAALSPKGAMGLMQLMPGTASLLSVSNPYDPVENIDGGMRYLKYLLLRFNGDLTLAVAAYNAGPEAVQRHGSVPPYVETKLYVNRVLDNYKGGNVGYGAYSLYKNPVVTTVANNIQRVVMSNGTVLYTNTSVRDYPGGQF
ncbi:MAG: lytic transglycosylase domain-containing protein [Nitrospirae bacterium]|nr:lytic transglycosylase domain-containing protein [Nitrospirota bacterium]MBF0593119.1 lytic transglycosylase domain-containing protein [Nitrospirota bacterium]